jgi:tetratricopeptide (TPR) repeat protein
MKLASAKKEKGDFQGAVLEYTKAIKLSNINLHDVSKLYSFRGDCKELLDDFRGAILDYTEAIKFEKNTFFRHYDYARRAKSKGYLKDYNGALSDITTAIDIEESKTSKIRSFSLPENYFFRGQIKLNMNLKDSGCVDLSKAGQLGHNEAYQFIKQYCN